MENLLKIIKGRRSIRSFHKDRKVKDEDINLLLEAAIWAPSGGNMQPWKFLVVKDPDTRKGLMEAAYGQEFLTQAPTSIVICIDKDKSKVKYGDRGLELYSIQNTAAAVQNILLCAHAMGLGTCWVGAFDEEKASKVLDIDKALRPVAIIPVGYAKEKPLPPERKNIDQVTQWL